MEHATIIGIDLAKRSFQLHGTRADGSVAFRRKLSRDTVLRFVAVKTQDQQARGMLFARPFQQVPEQAGRTAVQDAGSPGPRIRTSSGDAPALNSASTNPRGRTEPEASSPSASDSESQTTSGESKSMSSSASIGHTWNSPLNAGEDFEHR